MEVLNSEEKGDTEKESEGRDEVALSRTETNGECTAHSSRFSTMSITAL